MEPREVEGISAHLVDANIRLAGSAADLGDVIIRRDTLGGNTAKIVPVCCRLMRNDEVKVWGNSSL